MRESRGVTIGELQSYFPEIKKFKPLIHYQFITELKKGFKNTWIELNGAMLQTTYRCNGNLITGVRTAELRNPHLADILTKRRLQK